MAIETPPLRFYNTLTRSKEPFQPIDPANVRMYVCGPTVYDFAHIGNARPVIVFDVLFRLLRHVYGAEHVTYVRNITDVDDKINARAARDFPGLPLNEAIRKVTEKTAGQFHKDVAALGCLTPTVEPRATENIEQMIALAQSLLDRGHAYVAAGDEGLEVLFDVASMPDYGELSKRPLDEQQAGARVAVDRHKKNAADFVLWKRSDAKEPGWPARFAGPDGSVTEIYGRPGWHLECSAMSDRYLWAEAAPRLSPEARAHPHQFDIHAGGLDLIFPHHENEIAQSRCAHGTPVMANVWMHNGFLQVEGQKMSKSLGNFVTIHELLETEKFGGRKWPGEVLRLAMLMTHYREPIDFSVARLEEAADKLRGWQRLASTAPADALHPPDDSVVAELADDLNFHRASVALDVIARKAGRGVDTALACLAATLEFLGFTRDSLLSEEAPGDGAAVAVSVEARLAALAAKDFAKADAIRAELLEQGIQLMDYKDPATGERRTKWEVRR
ncbi:MAG: cysteine--tRNA ligase [Devosia sp.]